MKSGAAEPHSNRSPSVLERDVVVVGGGNAGLCAAITAREAGRSVLLIERAPEWLRGGNSRHTRDIRRALTSGFPYSEDTFLADLLSAGGDTVDRDVAARVVSDSTWIPGWMGRHGVRWQPALRGTLHLADTNAFMLGGGKAMLNVYYGVAAALGVQIAYGSTVEQMWPRNGGGHTIRVSGELAGVVHSRAAVIASGGYEANREWLRRDLGTVADSLVVRGTRHNDGRGIEILQRLGAASAGRPGTYHGVAVDARAPAYDGGIPTRVDAIPYGIVVNIRGSRFSDEGADTWPKRYASWGALISQQPGHVAHVIFDTDARSSFIPPMYPPTEAESVDRLADLLAVDRATLGQTVASYNAASQDIVGPFPRDLDGVSTKDWTLPKSNWARRLGSPPYFAYTVRPGITFTYAGAKVNKEFQVLDVGGQPIPGLFAAGEIVAGNILSEGYLAGIGLTLGTSSGIGAGVGAAINAR